MKRVLILAGFALICISALAIPFVKPRFNQAPLYKSAEAIEYVSFKETYDNVKGDNIVILQPEDKAILSPATWVPQTFNNCAPATVSMILQYFGFSVDQNTIKGSLRTNPDDKNVFTYEIKEYLAENYNIESKLFYNGNIQILKTLIANGFYVLVEDWLHPNEDIGHVTIIRGFDDRQGVFIADDSYMGVNITYKYDEFEYAQWKAFNREYLPVYTPDKEALLKAIVGEDWNEEKMYQKAIEQNKLDVEENLNDMYAWFNLGTSYFALQQYTQAKDAFEKSRSLGWPRRMLWYQIQPVQTYNQLGEYQKALELAQIGLANNDSFSELHLEKAYSYKGLKDLRKAKEEAQKALLYSPNLKVAQEF